MWAPILSVFKLHVTSCYLALHYSTRMGDLYIAPFVRNGTTEQWNDVTGGGGLLSLNFIIINHISRPYVFSELNHIE